MILFPPAKINLGLNITEKRSDGYHNIETAFYALPSLCDVLEILPTGEDSFSTSGIPVPGDSASNLIIKAREAFKDYLQHKGLASLPPCFIHLHKVIPFGSGLGGGSADAAYTLLGLNEVFHYSLPKEVLQSIARGIGSDCAFFLENSPKIGRGKGDEFSPIDLTPLKDYEGLLAIPPFSISTAQAYAQVKPKPSETLLESILLQSVENWKLQLKNDFEPALSHFELISKTKECFYKNGAVYASLSGSGSALFGIFPKNSGGLKRNFRKEVASWPVEGAYQFFDVEF